MSDVTIIGKAYRVWNELLNKYEKYSFWTKASDVELNDGSTVEAKMSAIDTSLGNKQDKLTNPLVQADIINVLTSTDSTKPLSAAQGKVLNDAKQNKTDNSLNTTNKNVVSAINEVLTKTNAKVKVNNTNVTSINFSLSGNTLTITTS